MSNFLKQYYLLIVFVILYSCMDVAKEVSNWMDLNPTEEVIGKFHYLENDGIKIFLPETFERYSSVKYQNLLDSLITKDNFDFEIKRLKSLREMEGEFYIYFDTESHSTYTINTMPYMPLYKNDAQLILGMISQNNNNITQNSDLEINKISAKYNDTNGTQIFKAIHQVSKKSKLEMAVNTSYIISSQHKTVYINLTTPCLVNFDMYLQKMTF